MAEQNDKMEVRPSSTSPFPYIVNSKTLSTSAVCEHCEKLKCTVQQAYQQSLDSSQCLHKAGGCYKNKLRLQLPRAHMKLEWCYECLSCDFKSYYLEDVEKHSVCHSDPVVCDSPVKPTDASGKRSAEPAVRLVNLDTPPPPQSSQSPIVANNCDDKKTPKAAKVLLFGNPASLSLLDASSATKSPPVPLKRKPGRPRKSDYDQRNAHTGGDNERPTLTCGRNKKNPYANRNVEKRAFSPVNTKILVLPSADTKNLALSLGDTKKNAHSDGKVEKGIHPNKNFKKSADQERAFPSKSAKKRAPTKKRDPVRKGRGSGKRDRLSETRSISFGGDVSLQSSLAQSKDTPPSSSTVVAVAKTSIVSTASTVVPNGNADHELRSPRSSIDLSKFSDLLGLKEVRQSNPNGANQVASENPSVSTEKSVDVLTSQTKDSHSDDDLSPHRKSYESRVRLPGTHTAPSVEGQTVHVSVIKQDVNEQEPNSLPTENANAVETITYTMKMTRVAPSDKPQPVFVLQPTMSALTSAHESTNASQPIPASDDKPVTVTAKIGSPTTKNQSPVISVALSNPGATNSHQNEQSKADEQCSTSDDRQNTTDGQDSAVNVPDTSASNDKNSATTEQQNTDIVGQDITIADHSYSKADSNNADNCESPQSQELLENKSSSEKLTSLPATRQPVVVISRLGQTIVRRHEDEKLAGHFLSRINENRSRPRKMTARKSTSAQNKVVVEKRLRERSSKKTRRHKPPVTVDASKTEAIKSAFSVAKSPQQSKTITGSSLILPIPTAQPEVATNNDSALTGTSWHSPKPQQNVALPVPGSSNLQSPTPLPNCKLSPLHVSTDLPPRSAPESIDNESTSEEDESNPWPSPEDQDTSLDASALKTYAKHSSKRRSASAKKHTPIKQCGLLTPLLTFGRPLSTPLSRASLSPHSSVRMSPRLKSSTRLTKEAALLAVSTLKILQKTCNVSPSPVKLLETGGGLDGDDKAVIRFVPDYATENIERGSRYFSENNPSGKSVGSGTDDEEDGSANVWPGPVLSDEEYRDHSLVPEGEHADANAHIKSETDSPPTLPERKRRKLVKFM